MRSGAVAPCRRQGQVNLQPFGGHGKGSVIAVAICRRQQPTGVQIDPATQNCCHISWTSRGSSAAARARRLELEV